VRAEEVAADVPAEEAAVEEAADVPVEGLDHVLAEEGAGAAAEPRLGVRAKMDERLRRGASASGSPSRAVLAEVGSAVLVSTPAAVWLAEANRAIRGRQSSRGRGRA
jgi:hypothetical protein